jgi:hypothetical protein
MERILVIFIQSPSAATTGIVGMLCFVAYPLFRSRSLLLATYLGNNLAFATHYGLSGQPTAESMNLIVGLQTLVAVGLVRWPRLHLVYYALMPILLLATAITWNGLPSLLCATATMLSAFGRMQHNQTALRCLMLASTPFWAAHDLLVESLPGLIADTCGIGTATWMLLKYARAANSPPPVDQLSRRSA